MKRFKLILILVVSVVLMQNCYDNGVFDDIEVRTAVDSNVVNYSIAFSDVPFIELKSKATSSLSAKECHIEDIYVLYFNGSDDSYRAGGYIEHSQILQSSSEVKFKTKVKPKIADKIILLANTGRTDSPDIIMKGKSISDINSVFCNGFANINKRDANWGERLPMSSEILSYDGDHLKTINVLMHIAVAKIQVRISPDIIDATGYFSNPDNISYVIRNLLKPADHGRILYGSQPYTTSSGGDFSNIDLNFKIHKEGESESDRNTYYVVAYNYGTSAKNGSSVVKIGDKDWHAGRLHLLLSVKKNPSDTSPETYYRLDFAVRGNDGNMKYINIEPGQHILFMINKVSNFGYSNIDDAGWNPGGNIDYTVITSNPENKVITSNGQYAVTKSNDGIVIVGNRLNNDGNFIDYEISTVRYQLLCDDNRNLDEIKDNDIFLSPTLSSRAEIVSPPADSDGNHRITDNNQTIKIRFKDDLSSDEVSVEGAVIIKLGSIRDTILVKRFKRADYYGAINVGVTGFYSLIKWDNNFSNDTSVENDDTSSSFSFNLPQNDNDYSVKGDIFGSMRSSISSLSKKSASNIRFDITKEGAGPYYRILTIKTNIPAGTYNHGRVYFLDKEEDITAYPNNELPHTFLIGDKLSVVTYRSLKDGRPMQATGWKVNDVDVTERNVNVYPHITDEKNAGGDIRLHIIPVDHITVTAIYSGVVTFTTKDLWNNNDNGWGIRWLKYAGDGIHLRELSSNADERCIRLKADQGSKLTVYAPVYQDYDSGVGPRRMVPRHWYRKNSSGKWERLGYGSGANHYVEWNYYSVYMGEIFDSNKPLQACLELSVPDSPAEYMVEYSDDIKSFPLIFMGHSGREVNMMIENTETHYRTEWRYMKGGGKPQIPGLGFNGEGCIEYFPYHPGDWYRMYEKSGKNIYYQDWSSSHQNPNGSWFWFTTTWIEENPFQPQCHNSGDRNWHLRVGLEP